MNSSIVRYILGHVLKIEAALMVIPVIVGVIYREKAISAFLITMALCAVCGILMTIKKPANTVFYLKEGCVTTALSWILAVYLILGTSLPTDGPGLSAFIRLILEPPVRGITASRNTRTPIPPIQWVNLFLRSDIQQEYCILYILG